MNLMFLEVLHYELPEDADLGKTDSYSRANVLEKFGRQVYITPANRAYNIWHEDFYINHPFPDRERWVFYCTYHNVYFVGGINIDTHTPAYPDMPWDGIVTSK